MKKSVIYTVMAKFGHDWKAISTWHHESAPGAMAAMKSLGADDVRCIGADDDHVTSVMRITEYGTVEEKRFSEDVSVDESISEVLQTPGRVWYPVAEATAAIRALGAAGLGGFALDMAWSLAHIVADLAGRDPEQVGVALADIAARGALQSGDIQFFDGGDFDLIDILAADYGTDRAEMVSHIVAGDMTHGKFVNALRRQIGEGLAYP